MKGYVEQLTEFLGPALTGSIGHVLVGLLILIVGLFIVRLLVRGVSRLLKKVAFLHRTNADGRSLDLAAPISSLLKAVLTVFVLMAVLQHFGLTDVLLPLRDMVDKFTAALPNIVGAGVIAYAGWLIARIASDFVGIALRKLDEQIAARTGNQDLQVSRFGSAFVFGGILLPIIVSALGVLSIPAISDPASAMIQKLMAAVPNIVGAAMILLVAYFVVRFVNYMLSGLLEGMNIDELPKKIGLHNVFSESFTPTKFTSSAVMFFSMLAAATAAVNVLGIDVISIVFARILEFGGGLLIGGVILIVGNFLSSMAYEKLSASGSYGLANISRIAILGLVLAMGLRSMGLADNIVNMAFGFTIGSVAVAAALAFGLGGVDAAKLVADRWASRIAKDLD